MKNFLTKTAKFTNIRVFFAPIVLLFTGILFMSVNIKAQSGADSIMPNPNGRVRAMVVQPDGKIIIGGEFTMIQGMSRNRIARLNHDGTLDQTFAINLDGFVSALALQPDGKIIAGGGFTNVSGITRNKIARFNADGTLDTTFDPNVDNTIYSIVIQPNGKIIAGGMFTNAAPNGGATVTRNHIARFETDGTLDTGFDPNVDGDINAMAIQSDGKTIIGGRFTSLAPNGGTSYNRENIARINADGTLDATVNFGVEGYVFSLAIQTDGKYIVGGGFSNLSMNGATMAARNCIARFNADGTLDTTFDPNINNVVFSLAIQPDGMILAGGDFSSVKPNGGATVTRNRMARINMNGSLDTAFNPNLNHRVSAMAVQTDGKILIGGMFSTIGGVPRNFFMRLEKGGLCDLWLYQNTNSAVYTTVLQPDGKILVGGDFTQIGGVTRNRLARLNADSTLDSMFNPNVNGAIYAILVQPDGKIIIGGDFTGIGGISRNRIARLNANGSVDNTFYSSANNSVRAFAAQPDGKILVGGAFTSASSLARNYISRINANGSVDNMFNANANNIVHTITVQPNGKILVGGDFTNIGGVPRTYIARLNENGVNDYTFYQSLNGNVTTLALQTDGKILIGGNFTQVGGMFRSRLARINTDGSIDMSFYVNLNVAPGSIAVQSDGKIFAGGGFVINSNGYLRHYFARFNMDGSIDSSFNAYSNGAVQSLLLQPDGKILVGGQFTQIGGAERSYFARLTNTAAALSTLNVSPTTLILTRNDAAAQFSRVMFEQSIDNGATWTTLGSAANSLNGTVINDYNDASATPFVPVSTGYALTGQNIPTGQNVLIRARGFYRASEKTGSEIVEDKVQNVYLPVPTAGIVSISGQVTGGSAGIRNTLVRLTFGNGDSVTTRSNAFGYFRFDEIAAGQTVTVSVTAINGTFSPQVVNVSDNVTDLIFTAN